MGWPYCSVDNSGLACCPFRVFLVGIIKWDGRCFRNSKIEGFSKISISSYFAFIREVGGENVVDLKLLKTKEQILGLTFVIGFINGFNFVEFWEIFWKCSHQ